MPVVTPDETGWRVGAKSHWLWAFVTPETTVYAILLRPGVRRCGPVLRTDYAGVLVRDGYGVYRRVPQNSLCRLCRGGSCIAFRSQRLLTGALAGGLFAPARHRQKCSG